MWFTCQHYIITSNCLTQPHNTSIQVTQPHYIIHQTIPCHDSLCNFCWHPSPYIYAAEVATPGVKNTRGTMEWLWDLGVQHPMQFFHTLLPFRLLSGHLAHLVVMGHSRICWLASSRWERPLHKA